MSVLVTGGAGYIGSHTVRRLTALGHEVVVLDSMEYGHRDAVIEAELSCICRFPMITFPGQMSVPPNVAATELFRFAKLPEIVAPQTWLTFSLLGRF